MASKWTDEQTRKLTAAREEARKSKFELLYVLADAASEYLAKTSGKVVIGSDEYWDYVVRKVGDGKTVKDYKDMREKTTKAALEEDRLTSTWTNEEIRKFKAAFEAGDPNLDTTEFWDYMAKEVRGSKTVEDCKELFVKGAIHASKKNKPKNEK